MDAVSTTDRVPLNTDPGVNRRITRETDCRVQHFRDHPGEIPARLKELDAEWDIERVLEANAAAVTLVSVVFGVLISRKWFALAGLAGAFLLQHAVQGWCPPLPILRRLGVRTQREIESERCALMAIRSNGAVQ